MASHKIIREFKRPKRFLSRARALAKKNLSHRGSSR